ncbi:MAG TPA: hypothetical protein DCY13_01565, partial [Verrucomicrobiales bacterium]|nr:hypothetical protein [Verrucomicrobiales bacterium]
MTAEQKDGPPGSARQRIPGLLSLALAGFLLLGFVAVVWINPDAGPAANGAKALPDGSSLELVAVAFTNKFGYQHRSTPRWLRPLSPLIPDAIENRFWSGGSMQIGGGETNLVLATVRRGGGGAAGAITLER